MRDVTFYRRDGVSAGASLDWQFWMLGVLFGGHAGRSITLGLGPVTVWFNW